MKYRQIRENSKKTYIFLYFDSSFLTAAIHFLCACANLLIAWKILTFNMYSFLLQKSKIVFSSKIVSFSLFRTRIAWKTRAFTRFSMEIRKSPHFFKRNAAFLKEIARFPRNLAESSLKKPCIRRKNAACYEKCVKIVKN